MNGEYSACLYLLVRSFEVVLSLKSSIILASQLACSSDGYLSSFSRYPFQQSEFFLCISTAMLLQRGSHH